MLAPGATMAKPSVLLVDDKQNLVRLLATALARSARVVPAGGVREAIAALEQETFGAIVCDLKMPDGSGLDVLRAARDHAPEAPFILMTAYASVATAVQAMREGAYDYVTKPFDPEEMVVRVERALAASAVADRDDLGLGSLVGRSPVMRDVFRTIRRVAPTDAPVLVHGEPGTGKELTARTVHSCSRRATGPIVVVDCAAIPRALMSAEIFGRAASAHGPEVVGAFEAADGGTLLLREVGDLGSQAQAALDRALEYHAFKRLGETRERGADVRLIATSRRELGALMRAHSLTEGLRARLAVGLIDVPPLRERTADIPLLANHMLAAGAAQGGARPTAIALDAMDRLVAFDWPGNVRELRSVIERAALVERGDAIRLASLPAELQAAPERAAPSAETIGDLTMSDALELLRGEANRRYLEIVMRKFSGDVAAAADHAMIERESFYRLLRRYGLSPSSFRQSK